MIRAYLFALDPTEAQVEAMRSHCGAARVAYNWCLARVLANWAQRVAEESYGIAEHERTPWINTSAYSLRKAWNVAKHEVAPWWAENSKEAYATGCANLATALGNRRWVGRGCRGSRPSGAPGCRAGSPPAASGRPATVGTCNSP